MNLVPHVKKVYLELTQQCNLNCVTCFRKNWHMPLIVMKDDVFNQVNASLHASETLEEIVIGGIGEPTTHPKFIEYVHSLPDVKLSITTNAFLWSDEVVDLLAKRFERVIISVDGLPETFFKIREFDYIRLEKNVTRLNRKKEEYHRNRPFLVAQLVLSTWNIEDVTPLFPYLQRMKFMKLILSNLLPQSEEDKDLIVYTKYDNQRLHDLKNEWLNASMRHQIQIKFPNIELKTERKCYFVEDGTTTITANGDVAPCYRFAHPSIEYVFGRRKQVYEFYYGNVLNQTLEEIYQSRGYVDLRNQNFANRFPSCPDCDLVDSCDYINDSLCDCKGQYPSCADCLWTRGFVECI